MVGELEHADLVIGKRLITDYPLHRRILSLGFNLLFHLLFRTYTTDTQCGFKAIKTPVLKKLASETHVREFVFDVELIVKAHRKGFNVKELPIQWQYKPGPKVSAVRAGFSMAKDLLKAWSERYKVAKY